MRDDPHIKPLAPRGKLLIDPAMACLCGREPRINNKEVWQLHFGVLCILACLLENHRKQRATSNPEPQAFKTNPVLARVNGGRLIQELFKRLLVIFSANSKREE